MDMIVIGFRYLLLCTFLYLILLFNEVRSLIRVLRASAQENRAKGSYSRKPNLPSFSVYKEVLTSLQTSWVYFPKCGRFLELFEILDFARLKPEIRRLTRENRPTEKKCFA